MAVNIQHFFMPPFVPFMCIQLGYFLRHGEWLTKLTLETVTKELPQRLLEWLLGSIILAPIFSVIMGVIVYLISLKLKNVVPH